MFLQTADRHEGGKELASSLKKGLRLGQRSREREPADAAKTIEKKARELSRDTIRAFAVAVIAAFAFRARCWAPAEA